MCTFPLETGGEVGQPNDENVVCFNPVLKWPLLSSAIVKWLSGS